MKVAELASNVGVSVGSIYTLFGSKENIYHNYILDQIDHYLEMLDEQIRDIQDPFEKLKILTHIKLNAFVEHKHELQSIGANHPLYFINVSKADDGAMLGKNAVLVVDFANQAVKSGKHVDEALLEAGEKRLRPILMTTFAMIFAMLPLALGSGAGHESNAPMAIAVIGGLTSSTLLTLLVVPALYRIMYPLDAWLRRFYEKGSV